MDEIMIKQDIQSMLILNKDQVAAMDTPYYVSIFKKTQDVHEIMILEFKFINDKETKETYRDDYLELNYGIRSGKVYKVCINSGTYLNTNMIKKIKRELDSSNLKSKRFDNNLKLCMQIVKMVITHKETTK